MADLGNKKQQKKKKSCWWCRIAARSVWEMAERENLKKYSFPQIYIKESFNKKLDALVFQPYSAFNAVGDFDHVHFLTSLK